MDFMFIIYHIQNDFSTKKGEQSTNCTPLKDLYYSDDIAPVKDISRPNTQSTDNIASITGEEANALQSERLNTLTNDDAPERAEQLTSGSRGEALLRQSLDNFPIKKVGRSVKSDTIPTNSSVPPIQENVKKNSKKLSDLSMRILLDSFDFSELKSGQIKVRNLFFLRI